MTDTLPSAEARSGTLRRFEQRRVEAEVRARLFGKEPTTLPIDRFEVRRKLGEGAMGIAYAAYDPQLQREVALKLLDVRSPAEAQAALQEARALARVSHESVLTVHEAGIHEGLAFIVSELVAGGTLREWLAKDPSRRAPKKVVPMLIAIARGVSAAHHRGIAHRDLKPDNVLVGNDGRPRVADFGLAVTAAPVPLASPASSPGKGSPLPGTIAYMAPEQLRGERADPLSDQFGFCVLSFEALFGRLPFEGATAGDLLRAIEAGAIAPVPATHAARKLVPILRRGLALESSARWPSMDDLVRALVRAGRSRLVLAGVLVFLGAVATTAAIVAGMSWGGGERRSDQKIIDKAIALNQAMRYDECADYLERAGKTDGAMQMWLGCAGAAIDPRKLERVCDAWPKRTSALLPETCAPFLRKARAEQNAGRYRECVETILAAPPTTAATKTLYGCGAHFREVALIRRQCKYMNALKSPSERKEDCDAGVKQIK